MTKTLKAMDTVFLSAQELFSDSTLFLEKLKASEEELCRAIDYIDREHAEDELKNWKSDNSNEAIYEMLWVVRNTMSYAELLMTLSVNFMENPNAFKVKKHS